MAHTPRHIALTASALVQREGGVIPFFRDVGIGGIAWALILQIIELWDGFGEVLVGVPKAFGLGVILLIEVFFEGSGQVLGAGAESAARSFGSGLVSLLGPLAQPVSVGTVMLSVFIFIWALNEIELNPVEIITG